jgi:two-component system cell cycle response regulator DivK
MPRMGGLEAVSRIKSQPDLARVIIIAVSGHAYPSDRDRALAAGCDAWITKPYDLRTVGDMLKQVTTDEFDPAPAG